ncbi:MAG: hypothetical protein HY235_14080 [Acidobacteria bacterium]|nr:hypothetical protein [Acidobacteriota bacterium]
MASVEFFLALACQALAQVYSAATVVNSATYRPELAPNAFGTIFGASLAYATREMRSEDVAAGLLPVVLPGTGVRVFLDGIAAPIWYVSPGQINFLAPGNLLGDREAKLWVTLDGRQGPEVLVRLKAESPGLFPLDPETIIAARLDGTLIQRESPAAKGQDILLFATGLGPTVPETPYRQLARGAAPIARRAEFRLLLNDAPVPDDRIRYVGVAPDFAGLYQINLRVPEDAPPDPEVRIVLGESASPGGLRLPLR